jgi:hypothetical protein
MLRAPLLGRLAHRESLPPGVYGGPLFERPPREAHWQGLWQAVDRLGDLFLYGNPFLAWSGGPRGERGRETTLAIDLAPGFERVWARFRGNHRRGVRDARRAGFELDRAREPREVDAYHAVYRDAIRRWGRRRAFGHFPARFFHALHEAGGADEWARLWLLRREGEVVGGAWILGAREHLDYWHACARRDVLRAFPMHLLVAEAVRAACLDGRRWFDLNPSGGLEGVELFKRGFRPEELELPLVRRFSAPLRAYRRVRRWGEKYLGRCPL